MIWKDKTILITGGTGSLGSALTEHLLLKDIRKLIIFSRDEFKQHEMSKRIKDERIRFFLGDVRDRNRLERAFRNVDVVIHAAALKQVPAMEYNPTEAVKTNIDGTVNVIEAAIDSDVDAVVNISSDKAVNPVNLYGATKLTGEKIISAANHYAGLGRKRFVSVRYGNVIGSRGSLVEFFDKLIERGIKVLPITDARMTRFWLTLDQAMCLIEYALEHGNGGEIFVPRLPSMRVVDFITALYPTMEHEFTGIRPGEKIHEILIGEDNANVKWIDLNKMKELPKIERYTSDGNDWWMSPSELQWIVRRRIEDVPL